MTTAGPKESSDPWKNQSSGAVGEPRSVALVDLPARGLHTRRIVRSMGDLEQPNELWPQIDALEAERTFEPEFRACRDLLALAWARKPAGVDGEAFEALLLAIVARSTLTFRAIMHLCRGGTVSTRTC